MKKLLIILLLLFAINATAQIDTANWSIIRNSVDGKYSLLTNRTEIGGVAAGGIIIPIIFTANQIDTSLFQLLPNQSNGKYSIATNKGVLYGIDTNEIRISVMYDMGGVNLNSANTWTGVQRYDTLYAKRFNYGLDTTGYIATNGKIYAPNGNATKPSYSFTDSLNSGIYRTNNSIAFSLGGANVGSFTSTGVQSNVSYGGFKFSNGHGIFEDGLNIINMRNGEAPQTFRISEQNTSVSNNFRRLEFGFRSDSTAYIRNQFAGRWTWRPLIIYVDSLMNDVTFRRDAIFDSTIAGTTNLRGQAAFNSTDLTDTVIVANASVADIYFITLTGTVAGVDETPYVEATATGFIVRRNTGTTSGLTYNWLRIK